MSEEKNMFYDKNFINLVEDDNVYSHSILNHINKNFNKYKQKDVEFFLKNSFLQPSTLNSAVQTFEIYYIKTLHKNDLVDKYFSRITKPMFYDFNSEYNRNESFRHIHLYITGENIKKYINPKTEIEKEILKTLFITKATFILSDIDATERTQALDDVFYILQNSQQIQGEFINDNFNRNVKCHKFLKKTYEISFKDKTEKFEAYECISKTSSVTNADTIAVILAALAYDQKKIDFFIENIIFKLSQEKQIKALQAIVINDLKISEDNFNKLIKINHFNNSTLYYSNFVSKPSASKTSNTQWNYAEISAYRWLPIKYIKSNLRKLKPFIILSFLDDSLISDFFKITNFKKKEPKDYFNSLITERYTIYKQNPDNAYDFFKCSKVDEPITNKLCSNCINKHVKSLDPNTCKTNKNTFMWTDELFQN